MVTVPPSVVSRTLPLVPTATVSGIVTVSPVVQRTLADVGTHEVEAKATLTLSSSATDTVNCVLEDTTDATFDSSVVELSTAIAHESISLFGFDNTSGGGGLSMLCYDNTGDVTAAEVKIAATQLSSASGVTGS